MIRKAQEGQNPHAWVDIKRIVKIPIAEPITQAEVDEIDRQWVLAPARRRGFKIMPHQAAALLAWQRHEGGFIKVGVGMGKTLISLLIAQAAYQSGKYKRILLHVPAHVYLQLVVKDLAWTRTRVRFTVPVHKLGNTTGARRRAIAQQAKHKKGLYILPYSCLSTKDAHEVLWGIAPSLIIADECQKVASPRSARARRWRQYVNQRKPRIVVLSGTITRKGVSDYHQLATSSLRENCFLPLSPQMASEWGQVLNSTGFVDRRSATGPLRPLIDWAEANRPGAYPLDLGGFRKAFKARMESTPGVVSAGTDTIGTSLVICNRPVPQYEKTENWRTLHDHIEKINTMWITPCGDEIEHAIHAYKWLWELSAGFYNALEWPSAEKVAERRSIPLKDAARLLKEAVSHHAAHQEYARQLRRWLQDHPDLPNLDTPFLVGGDMKRHGASNVTRELYDTWTYMRDLARENMIERDSFPVRVCPFKIDHAVEWVTSKEHDHDVVVWYHHQEMGRWLVEAMRKEGHDNVLHCPAGNKANQALLDPSGKIVVASMRAHGVGKNLQMLGDQFFVEWLRGARDADQTIGRTHRHKQLRDTVTVYTNHTLEWDHENYAVTLNDALYIHETMQPHKLMYCTHDPIPKVVPFHVLKVKGFQPRFELSTDMKRNLAEKFG